MRRILYVFEARNQHGEFEPQIGFSDREHLNVWMRKVITPDLLAQKANWRVVLYVPSGRPDGPVYN